MLCMMLVEDPVQRRTAAKVYAALKEAYDTISDHCKCTSWSFTDEGNAWFELTYPDQVPERRQYHVLGGFVDMSVPGKPFPKKPCCLINRKR
jgi:hypothetical protein